MGNTINLADQPTHLEENQELVADLCRFQEGILTEQQVKKKWKFDKTTWDALGESDGDGLVRAVEAKSVRRIRDGSCKREKSQLLVVKAPEVAAGIMNSASSNDRHRLDACKVLSDFASNGPAGVPAADRFQITIVLNSDVERFDKSIEVNPNDQDPHHPDDTSRELFPVITAKKDDDQ